MADVMSKHAIQTIENLSTADLWHEFREVEVLNLAFTQEYQHSLGKYSKFFIELENRKFVATHCPNCERVYAPPRPLCPDCLTITTWTELSGEGTLQTFSVMHFGSGANADVENIETPYVLAYVLLDGASTLFPHILKTQRLEDVKIGLRVRVEFVDHPVHHPIHLMHFVPTGLI